MGNAIGMSDEVRVALGGKGVSVLCDSAAVPSGEGNIAFKAAAAMIDIAGGGAGLTIEIKKNVEKGTWRYSIKNAEGKTIAMPLPQLHWETKEECLKAVEELKMILNKGKTTDFKEAKDSK